MVQDQFDPEYYLGQYETYNSNTQEQVWCMKCHGSVIFYLYMI